MPRKNFQTDRERLREVSQLWVEPVAAPDIPDGRPFENLMTTEEYMQLFNADCYYCGDSVGANYIEPIDETKPLHQKNTVCLCVHCKRLKGNLSRTEYKAKADREVQR